MAARAAQYAAAALLLAGCGEEALGGAPGGRSTGAGPESPASTVEEPAPPPSAPDFEVLAGGRGHDALNPSLGGDLLAYIDLADDENGACYRPRGEDPDCVVAIVAKDLATGQQKVLEEGLGALVHPVVAGDSAVSWLDPRDGQIHLYSFASGEGRVISVNPWSQGPPRAGGGSIGWVNRFHQDRGIIVWDLADARRRVVRIDDRLQPGQPALPTLAVRGLKVVVLRQHQRDDGSWGRDLWFGDAADDAPPEGSWITQDPAEDGFPYAPALAGDAVLHKAWFPSEEGCGIQDCEHAVFARPIPADGVRRLSPDGARPSATTGIAQGGGHAAWLEVDGPFYRAVALKLSTGEIVARSPEGSMPVATSPPTVTSTRLAWTDASSGRPVIASIPIR